MLRGFGESRPTLSRLRQGAGSVAGTPNQSAHLPTHFVLTLVLVNTPWNELPLLLHSASTGAAPERRNAAVQGPSHRVALILADADTGSGTCRQPVAGSPRMLPDLRNETRHRLGTLLDRRLSRPYSLGTSHRQVLCGVQQAAR